MLWWYYNILCFSRGTYRFKTLKDGKYQSIHSTNITRSLMKSFREIDRLTDVIFVKSPHEDLLRVFAKQNTCANLLWHFFGRWPAKPACHSIRHRVCYLSMFSLTHWDYGSEYHRAMENITNRRSLSDAFEITIVDIIYSFNKDRTNISCHLFCRSYYLKLLCLIFRILNYLFIFLYIHIYIIFFCISFILFYLSILIKILDIKWN